MKARVAIVDDEVRMAEVLAMVLRRDDRNIEVFHRPSELLAAMGEAPFDVIVSDLKMPEMDGVELLAAVRARAPASAFILITAHATVETAIEAMKRGAFDYLTKPVDNEACRSLVARALELTRLDRENRYLRAELRTRYGLDAIVARSDGMARVLDLARRAATSTSTVLISGESGTGKELVARAIHYHSPRVGAAFVAVNCKAFADGVVESELFGHEKGAFTGASSTRRGVFERAHGGTLFLDEIGEIGPELQAKLLRVLQERELQRVGGDAAISVDVRLIAATNRDLRAEVDAGRFREDLYYRLAVIPIHIPPLRERRADILPIARLVLERHNERQGRALTGWTDEVETWLLNHYWPGNVRELENTLERGVVLGVGDQINLEDIAVTVDAPRDAFPVRLREHLDAATVVAIREALTASGGVRQDAAERLGIERTTLYRLMKRYRIDES